MRVQVKAILLTILICLWASGVWGATDYTVCSSGCDETAIQDVFDNNDLGANDTITVSAGTYREAITWGDNDSGTGDTDRVTLQVASGETVIINAATVLSTGGGGYWEESDTSNEWFYHSEGNKAGDPGLTEAHVLFVSTTLWERGTLAALSTNEWVWGEPQEGEAGCGFDTIVVYSTTDPDTAGTQFEIGGQNTEQSVIDLNDQSYITIDGSAGTLILQGGNDRGVYGGYTASRSSYITITDCIIRLSARSGVETIYGDNWTISNNDIYDIEELNDTSMGDGICVRDSGHNEATNITVSGNSINGVHRQGVAFIAVNTGSITDNTFDDIENTDVDLEPNHADDLIDSIEISGNTFNDVGVSINATFGTIQNITVTENTFTADGNTSSIRVDTATTGIEISKNYMTNQYVALYVIDSGDCTFKQNWVEASASPDDMVRVDSGNVTAYANVIIGGVRIFEIDSGETATIYNNTLINWTVDGIRSLGTSTVKNNLFYNTGADGSMKLVHDVNTGTYSNNLYYIPNDSDNIWRWADVTNIDNLTAWAAQSGETGGIQASPDFYSGGYCLQPTSPCVNAGTDLGDSYDDLLAPRSSWPDSVATTDADDIIPVGTGWPIGAYAPADYLSTLEGTTQNTIWRHDGAEGQGDWFVDSNGHPIQMCLAQGRIYITAEATGDEITSSYVEYLYLDDQAAETLVADYCGFPDASATVAARAAGNGTATFSNGTYSATHDECFIDWDNGDFHQWSSSPLINKGENITGLTTDYSSRVRPRNGINDIGPYEGVWELEMRPWMPSILRFIFDWRP